MSTSTQTAIDESILRSLRRISRAIGLYSRQIASRYQLTTPQLVCLRHLRHEPCSPGELARAVSLSPPTVTGILDRLGARGLIVREPHPSDKRRLVVAITGEGAQLLEAAPMPLHEKFAANLARLGNGDQKRIDKTLKQVVAMMEAEHLDAVPFLDSDPDSLG